MGKYVINLRGSGPLLKTPTRFIDLWKTLQVVRMTVSSTKLGKTIAVSWTRRRSNSAIAPGSKLSVKQIRVRKMDGRVKILRKLFCNSNQAVTVQICRCNTDSFYHLATVIYREYFQLSRYHRTIKKYTHFLCCNASLLPNL